MKRTIWQSGVLVVLALISISALLLAGLRPTARAEGRDEAKAMAGPHYTVVMTEGDNLIVVDNATNKLYFYTKDKDAPIGSPVKRRATVDLTQVGGEEIRASDLNLQHK